jgi:uncharacterized protein
VADVVDDAEHNRYTINVDGDIAGFTEYHDHGTTRALMHTVIDPAYEGHGLGSELARRALDDARARGLAILPCCPFVRSYIAKHRDYVDLVPADRRGDFDLAETTK